MNADGVPDVEWEVQGSAGGKLLISGEELDALAAAGERADNEAIDLMPSPAFEAPPDAEARKAFIGLMWRSSMPMASARAGEHRLACRRADRRRTPRPVEDVKAAAEAPGATGTSSDE
jgi:uncharacterized tellurite resistance protein B-like protein